MARNGRCIHNKADQNPERNKQDQYKASQSKRGKAIMATCVCFRVRLISERAQWKPNRNGGGRHSPACLTFAPNMQFHSNVAAAALNCSSS